MFPFTGWFSPDVSRIAEVEFGESRELIFEIFEAKFVNLISSIRLCNSSRLCEAWLRRKSCACPRSRKMERREKRRDGERKMERMEKRSRINSENS